MALHNVIVEVDYLDAAERTATREYMLQEQYNDADPGASMVLIQAAAADVVAALEVLSWSDITNYRIVVDLVNTDASANIAANNQVVAFVRTRTTSGLKSSFEVVAWDDAVYDQNSQNMLSPAWITAAEDLLPLLKDAESGEDMTSIDYAQSRTRKSRNVVHD